MCSVFFGGYGAVFIQDPLDNTRLEMGNPQNGRDKKGTLLEWVWAS